MKEQQSDQYSGDEPYEQPTAWSYLDSLNEEVAYTAPSDADKVEADRVDKVIPPEKAEPTRPPHKLNSWYFDTINPNDEQARSTGTDSK